MNYQRKVVILAALCATPIAIGMSVVLTPVHAQQGPLPNYNTQGPVPQPQLGQRFILKKQENLKEQDIRLDEVEATAILDRETGNEYICFRSRSGEGSSFWCDRTGRNWKE